MRVMWLVIVMPMTRNSYWGREMKFQSTPVGSRMQVLLVMGRGPVPIEYTAVHYRAAHTYTALISVSVSLVDRLMTPSVICTSDSEA